MQTRTFAGAIGKVRSAELSKKEPFDIDMNTYRQISGIFAAAVLVLAVSLSCGMEPPRSNAYDPENNTDSPQVLSTTPGAGEKGVPWDRVISATFSEDVYELSVNHTSFAVLGRNSAYVSGKITCEGRTITFEPHVPLDSAQSYKVIVTTAVTDYALNPLAGQYEWDFQTVPEFDPGPNMVIVEGGEYVRGSNVIADEEYQTAEDEKKLGIYPESLCGPEHKVSVSKFYIGKFEVTMEEYGEYCVARGIPKPAAPFGEGKMPVIYVSWYDAVNYCNWLSGVMGYEPCYSTADNINYTCDFSKNGYRLPTEAEWEYAARFNSVENKVMSGDAFSGYIDGAGEVIGDYAVYVVNSGGGTWRVGSKNPNGLGICDMSGNVREWCWDWNEYWVWFNSVYYGLGVYTKTYYTKSKEMETMVDPRGETPDPEWPLHHTLRGGSWYYEEMFARSALHADYRHSSMDLATRRNKDAGFRLCRTYKEEVP